MMVDAKLVLLDEVGAGVNRTLLKDLGTAIEKLNREKVQNGNVCFLPAVHVSLLVLPDFIMLIFIQIIQKRIGGIVQPMLQIMVYMGI